LSARAVALLEEHQVDDLRPGVLPFGLVFSDEVQREHPRSIDLVPVVPVENPELLEGFRAEGRGAEPHPEETIKGGDATEDPQHGLGHEGVAGPDSSVLEPLPDSPTETVHLIDVVYVAVSVKVPDGRWLCGNLPHDGF